MKFPFSTMLILRTLLAGGMLLCAPAFAGAVYKCTGPDGQIAFTNKIGTFTHCQAVASYADKAPPTVAEEAAKGKHIEYRSQPGDGEGADTGNAPAPAAAEIAPPASPEAEVRRGAVYKVAKTNGITEYTNVRPNGGAYTILFTYMATCYACNVHSSVDWANTPLNLSSYNDEIASAASEYGVDPSLLRAIIHAESAFNPSAVSIKGAQGLMQLMPGTASDLGVDNPFDAAQNIRGGAQYLGLLLKQFNGNERLAAAAYDAGAQNVQKYNGVPPFDETQVYVERVSTLHKRYRDASSPPASAPAASPSS
jgi:soluble lytic murein transglycosylase-like protein